MQGKSLALSRKAESIILESVKDRLIDAVFRSDNAEDFSRIAREKIGHFYENVALSSLDLGVKEGKALDLGTQFGLCAISLARQDYDFEITSFQDSVKSVEISRNFAEKDIVEERIKWAMGKQESLPFADRTFDLVISGFDMHHWENPVLVFNEIDRVLKKNGALLIADLRRDAFSPMIPLLKAITSLTNQERIYEEVKHSFRSSYKKSEVAELLGNSSLEGCEISKDLQFVYIRRRRFEKRHIKIEISTGT